MSRLTVTEEEPGWGRSARLWRPDLPLVWLTLGLVLFGAVVLQARISPAFVRELSASSLAWVTWTLYAVPFVLLVALLDLLEPEPPAFLASAFGWGMMVATPIALVANGSALAIVADVWGVDVAMTWGPAIVAPITEEVLKTLGVVVVVLVARRQVTTVLDGLVYGAFVGLGFQVAENFLYTTDDLRGGLFGREPGQVVIDVFLNRGLELGLWSHTAYSALAGFGVAYMVCQTHRGRLHRALVGAGALLAAWGVHALWNAPFTQVPADAGVGQELGTYALKGLPALLLVLVLVALAHGREVLWFVKSLDDEDPDVVSPDELAALRNRRSRRGAVAAARARGGTEAARAARQLQAAQVRLAVCKAAGDLDADLDAARQEVRLTRSALGALAVGPGDEAVDDPLGR